MLVCSRLKIKHSEHALEGGRSLIPPLLLILPLLALLGVLYLHITQRPTQGAQLFRPLLSQVEEISLFS